jgi:hypothetical protein
MPVILTAPGHLAATYDGSSARLFVNGVLESSLAVSGSLKATLEPMVVGNAGEACRLAYAGLVEFDGVIDEVELYGRALDASDIQAISARQRGPVPVAVRLRR